MAIIRRTNTFLKDYCKLPGDLKSLVDKQLSLLIQNPRHPSLNFKKLKGTPNFEIRISKGYRLTLSYKKNILELRRVATHDILKKED